MTTALTTIFGNEICVGDQPPQVDRQYVGFPGANGIVGMNLGDRGKQIVITGRLRESGASYQAARTALRAIIAEIGTYLHAAPATYTFMGDTYENTVFDRLNLLPNDKGKLYFYNSAGEMTADFVCFARQMICE
jgi:hypothetical protein